MSYPTAFGALLRLAANTDRGLRPLGPLIRGLKAMLSCRDPAHVPGPGRSFDDSQMDELTRDDRRTFGAGLVQEIAEIGRRIGLSRPPDVFLLWENSD